MPNYFASVLYRTRILCVACPLLVPCASKAQAGSLSASNSIANVIDVLGIDTKPGGTGELNFTSSDMILHVHDHSTVIPLRSILAFSIVREDKALISGTKGKVAEAMPYGIGFAVSMTRKPADTLTLFYRDSNQAIHGCVLVLPKGMGQRVDSALASTGLSETAYPKTDDLTASEKQQQPEGPIVIAQRSTLPSVVLALPSESMNGIPPAFPAAIYEDLVEQLTQSQFFAHVWRAGDNRKAPDALVLHLDIESWKKGSARGRGFGPFTGATDIKSRITLVNASGQTVFQGEVGGSKRMNGESIEVGSGLAKHIRKALEKSSELHSDK